MRTTSDFDVYEASPNTAQQQWFQTHFWEMQLSSPYFDSRLTWYSRAISYYDLYGIHLNDPLVAQHPEWILKDQNGNYLFVNYGCTGQTCPQYAFDFSNPGFQQRQIGVLAKMMSAGYRGLWLDNVDLQVETSNGQGQTVYPIDPNTGQQMTGTDWEKYMAGFTTNIRQAFPKAQLVHNSIWYAGSQPAGTDPYVQLEIQAADWINLERGVSDNNLTVGTGKYSLYSMLSFVDRVHALGKNVSVQEFDFNGDYGLAGYYLISSGLDALGNNALTPLSWWSGYDFDIGTPAGPRYSWQGVFRRDFSNGIVLLNPFGGATVSLSPTGNFINTQGSPVSSVTLAGGQAAVLINAASNGMRISGMANAAGYSSAAFSAGEIVTIYGDGIGPPSLASSAVEWTGQLSTLLGGATQVSFDGIPAPLVYVTATQASAILPYELAGSREPQVVVTYNGSASEPFPITIAATAPGLFAQNQQGYGPGLIYNQDGSLNTSENPAAAGSIVTLFGTGEGVPSWGPLGGVTTGQIVPLTPPFPAIADALAVTIGGVPCQLTYAGSVPGYSVGLFQINVVVPDGAPRGEQPIQVQIGGIFSQENLTISVQ